MLAFKEYNSISTNHVFFLNNTINKTFNNNLKPIQPQIFEPIDGKFIKDNKNIKNKTLLSNKILMNATNNNLLEFDIMSLNDNKLNLTKKFTDYEDELKYVN